MSGAIANRQGPLAGIAFMVASGLCFIAVNAIVKWLGPRLPPAEAAFLRYALGLVFILPLLPQVLREGLPRPVLGMAALRGGLHAIGVMLWFYAMTRIPIADVTAINFLSPVFVSIGAALFLGERLAMRRIAAVLAGLIGALVILRPGLREVSAGDLAMVTATVAFSASYLLAKRLTDLLSPVAVLVLMSLGVTTGLAPFALAHWVAPTLDELGWLFVVAAFATLGHYFVTRAFAAAPLAVTQPASFLQLVWATILGVSVFSEPIDGWTILGGTIIVGATSYISWREALVRGRALTPPEAATKL
jgi:drug/metabolite transporter (DMT)-like permease